MAKAKRNKSQHYVPRTYLGAWSDPDSTGGQAPYVWLFPRDDRTGRRKAPKNVFEETDFYTVTRADGTRSLVIEDSLAKLEDTFAKIRGRTLARQEPLSGEEKLDVLTFFAAMSFRTKAHRDFMREQWGRVKGLGDLMTKQIERSTPEERRTLQSMNIAHDPTAPSFTLEQVSELASNPIQNMLATQMEANLPVFARMDILILTVEDEVGFITSDHPCVWMDPDAYKRPPMYRQPQILSRDIELSMPISPRQMLVLNWGLSGYMRVGRRMVDEYNRRTRYHAYEHFVVRKNATYEIWFSPGAEPDDSWEKVRTREKIESEGVP